MRDASKRRASKPTGRSGTAQSRTVRVPGAPWWTSLLLWIALLLLEASPLVLLQALPWARGLDWWTLPAALGSGIVLGIVLVATSRAARWWLLPMPLALLLALACLIGGTCIMLGERDPQATLAGLLLFGIFATVLTTLLPWLIFIARQTWLALALLWFLVAGAWGAQSNAVRDHETWWLGWLLVLSLLVLGFQHLRVELGLWRALDLQRIGQVRWQAFRAVAVVTILVALVAFVPVHLTHVAALTQLWQQAPIAQRGVLPYRGESGTPQAILGAPLSVNAQSVSNHQILYTYSFISGLPQQTPLLGETFDTFDGTTWTQAPVAATVPTGDPLAFPEDAQLLRARVTVETAPDLGTAPLLLGFSQPISFSVPAQVRVLADGSPTTLTVADWRTTIPLAKGASYETYAAVLTDDVQPQGVLPAALQERMTAVPTTLTPIVRATAQKWVGTAKTPVAQARTLLAALKKHVTLDASALPPRDVDPVAWAIQQQRANGLLLTTSYITLGRAIGLPLRLAEGYLPGTYDTQLQQLVVRASDGTVWAQLAIPGKGWLDILTVTSEHIVIVPRSAGTTTLPPTPAPTQVPGRPLSIPGLGADGIFAHPDIIGIGAGGIVVAFLLLATLIVGLRWSAVGRKLGPLPRALARLAVLARLGGVALEPSDTAVQGTAKVAARLSEQNAATLRQLNATYERLSYGPPLRMPALFPDLRRQWRQLRGALLRLVLARPWRRDVATRRVPPHTPAQLKTQQTTQHKKG